MLWTLFITLHPPANEKLTGTANAVEVNLESGPRLTSGEAAAAEGLVIAAEGEAAAPEGVVVVDAGGVAGLVPPQAASAIKVAQQNPIEGRCERVRCIWAASTVIAPDRHGRRSEPLGWRTLAEARSDLCRPDPQAALGSAYKGTPWNRGSK